VIALRSQSKTVMLLIQASLSTLVLAACSPTQFQSSVSGPSVQEVSPPVPTATPPPSYTPPPYPNNQNGDNPTATPSASPSSSPTPVVPSPTPVVPSPTPVVPSPTPVVPSPTPVPTPSKTADDTFLQDDRAGKVDILIIDDNSFSMDAIQRKLAARFSSLTNSLKDLNYQIGVTTTDLDSPLFNQDGRLLKWNGTSSNILTPSTVNADSVFTSTITRKETIGCNLAAFECPSGNEQPAKAVIRAIQQKNTANLGFFRDGVDLAVIIVSNEDELSNGAPTTGLNGKPLVVTEPKKVLAAVATAFQDSKRFVVHSIVIKPNDKACLAAQKALSNVPGNAFYAIRTTSLSALTGGDTFSVCDRDYSPSLEAISNSVRKLIGTFELQHQPIPGSVRVTLTPRASIGFTVSGKKLIFDSPPLAGTRIDVSYSY
jgi:hypothetical protein